MRCPGLQTEVDAYVDGELSAIESAAFETHLQSCQECRDLCERNRRLRETLQDPSLYHRAPARLLERIDAAIADEAHEDSAHEDSAHENSTGTRGGWSRRSLALAAVTAMAACIIITILLLNTRTAPQDLLAQEIVSDHVRSMMADHLLDVPSTDRHTVKPWFDGKLDFAPPVIDTSAQGFPLIGGRLEYLADRPVAALVFKRQQHVINLYVWTSGKASDETDRVLTRQGYNLVHWNRAGMTFWAVSDLELPQLQQFSQAQQAADVPQTK